MGNSTGSGPLAGLVVVEQFGAGSTELGRVAVSFAGLLASRLGAQVIRALPEEADPLRTWPPYMADGSSALLYFLNAGKAITGERVAHDPLAFLLTDDEARARAWAGQRKLRVHTAFDDPSRAGSELTMAAATGLLDIVADPGMPPLPLPGYQMAFAAGLSAFCAMQASVLAGLLHGTPVAADVSAHETGVWLNWKHRLDEVSGQRESGIERQEEWKVMPCLDGFVAPVFRDVDMPNLAEFARNPRLADEEFRTSTGRVSHIEELHRILGEAVRHRTREQVVREADRLRLPFAAVLTPREILDDPQILAREFMTEHAGSLQPHAPVLWNGQRLDVRPTRQ